MENIYIQTSQNISLEQTVASIGERILAQLIDYLFIGAYSLIAWLMYTLIEALTQVEPVLFTILLSLPVLFYDLFCETFFNGQNVGKRFMKLKVVTVNGSQPEFMSYFIRWMFRILDTLATFGAIATFTIIFNGKGRRLGDIAAGTMVIRLKPIIHSDLFVERKLPANYQPIFREAQNLSDKDFAIIREIFDFRMKNGDTSSALQLMENAKTQFCAKMNIQSSLSAKEFLNQLEKDFIYFNSNDPKN